MPVDRVGDRGGALVAGDTGRRVEVAVRVGTGARVVGGRVAGGPSGRVVDGVGVGVRDATGAGADTGSAHPLLGNRSIAHSSPLRPNRSEAIDAVSSWVEAPGRPWAQAARLPGGAWPGGASAGVP